MVWSSPSFRAGYIDQGLGFLVKVETACGVTADGARLPGPSESEDAPREAGTESRGAFGTAKNADHGALIHGTVITSLASSLVGAVVCATSIRAPVAGSMLKVKRSPTSEM
jgi:hypothetical protein